MAGPEHGGYLHCLSDALVLELTRAPPDVRRMVEHLISSHAAARLMGVGAIQAQILRGATLAPTAPRALPFLFALAGAPGYPHASAVLTRLGQLLSTLDDPPRSLASAEDGGAFPEAPLLRDVWQAFEARVPMLLRVARSSRDPEAARAAGQMAGHFPSADPELVPLLVALLSGTRDPQQRAPLLHRLAHAQVTEAGPLHPRVLRALDAPTSGPDHAAVVLALAEHRLEPSLHRRVVGALEALAAADDTVRRWPDPRSGSGPFDRGVVSSALERLRRRTPLE
ncbi:MAG: hypothetical protein ACOCV4_08510 [Myxococcota bacterium]